MRLWRSLTGCRFQFGTALPLHVSAAGEWDLALPLKPLAFTQGGFEIKIG